MRLDADNVFRNLKYQSRCDALHFEAKLDSTNTFAKHCIPKKIGHFTLVNAEIQTAGRGRFGRAWLAPAGSHLTFSLAISLGGSASSTLPLVVALSLCQTLSQYDPEHFTIKWPNDIWYKQRKIAGILIENVAPSQYATSLVIGIGLNIKTIDLPSNLQGIVALDEVSIMPDSNEVLFIKIVDALIDALDEYVENGFAVFVDRWYQYDALSQHTSIMAKTLDKELYGHYEGISLEGFLKLRSDEGKHYLLNAADVSIRTRS